MHHTRTEVNLVVVEGCRELEAAKKDKNVKYVILAPLDITEPEDAVEDVEGRGDAEEKQHNREIAINGTLDRIRAHHLNKN